MRRILSSSLFQFFADVGGVGAGRAMLSRRRFWLAPAIFFLIVIYFVTKRPLSSGSDSRHYGNVRWQKRPARYPISDYTALPKTGTAIPRIQFDFSSRTESPKEKTLRLSRRQKIKDAFIHAWSGYTKHAFGKDEVRPINGGYRNSFGGWGATLVDSLDTLWLMGLREEFVEAVDAVEKIDFTTNTEKDLNVFETTIRYIGGLLSAYDLSERRYESLLTKATELADMLYAAFDTPNHFPVCRWDWRKAAAGVQLVPSDYTLLAEVGSLSVEFTRLSQLTGDPKYYDVIARISKHMVDAQDKTLLPGLWPTIVNTRDLKWDFNHFTFGGMADSTYEYLPKEYLLLNGADQSYGLMYERAITTAEEHLFFRPMIPTNAPVLFSGTTSLTEQGHPSLDPQGQHLTCFTAGMLAIGSKIFDRPNDLHTAKQLLDGCIWAYNATPSGLMPETFHVWDDDRYYAAIAARHTDSDEQPSDPSVSDASPVEHGKLLAKQNGVIPGFTAHGDNRYILRPEAIESIFILYRVTGDTAYQEAAWRMWEAIDRATKTKIANAAIFDVRMKIPLQSDRMESFWLAETLKYFWLVFGDPVGDGEVDLDEWVLNTEAHPFRRPTAA
ncbi:Mannosyl-oligosaccharide 1,2-alpha-mannosidase MNS1 [Cyphellophora attinorum]|uniref:alpha-1,2-Mannosidase n=1 Tax=Cyphellophora attinorum TaxID=1664694 RepID=A0A0N1P039_9EURO|nr:Mannosyl-oligosaccharide 1,2-alpha-mannosidase MNS1 [Phialophora attinorum]KPI39352.1 Mannosyl-oligosaccharide 1,2-alpha-mannosidase MNS1 [Phialophora attinorum]